MKHFYLSSHQINAILIHFGSNSGLLGFISRPQTEDVGHTYRNIPENQQYTINHIHPEFAKNAHYTSARFDKDISEFDRCGLTEEYTADYKAPIVKESTFKMGMRFKEAIDIKLNVGLITPRVIIEQSIAFAKANNIPINSLEGFVRQIIGWREFDPDEVYRWFMKLFIDSYDWVMVPNVYGMSQFTDGRLTATKPYISGSNYLMKMSNYKKGEWQAIWDGFFWRFMDTHRSFFLSNPRLGMLIRMFDKMPI